MILLKLLIAILIFLAVGSSFLTFRLILINALVDAKNREFPFYLLVTCFLWTIITISYFSIH